MVCLRYSPDDPYHRLGPVHTCLYVRVRETGDWDLFQFGSLSREAPISISDFLSQFLRNRTRIFFPPEIIQGFWLQFQVWYLHTLFNPFPA